MVDFLLMVVLLVFAVATWGLVCNNRCYRQRQRLIDLWGESEDWEAGRDAFRQVDYDAHLWRLFTFRDPLPLYADPLNASAVKAGGL